MGGTCCRICDILMIHWVLLLHVSNPKSTILPCIGYYSSGHSHRVICSDLVLTEFNRVESCENLGAPIFRRRLVRLPDSHLHILLIEFCFQSQFQSAVGVLARQMLIEFDTNCISPAGRSKSARFGENRTSGAMKRGSQH